MAQGVYIQGLHDAHRTSGISASTHVQRPAYHEGRSVTLDLHILSGVLWDDDLVDALVVRQFNHKLVLYADFV